MGGSAEGTAQSTARYRRVQSGSEEQAPDREGWSFVPSTHSIALIDGAFAFTAAAAAAPSTSLALSVASIATLVRPSPWNTGRSS
jgi:hypothetical protein